MQNHLTASRQLKRVFGGTEGYQITKSKRPIKKVPSWVNNNFQIQQMLLVSFPRMKSDPRERERAARWARIIYLYYRRQWGRGQIAHEMGLSYHVVNRIIYRIRSCAEGLRTDGKERKFQRKLRKR